LNAAHASEVHHQIRDEEKANFLFIFSLKKAIYNFIIREEKMFHNLIIDEF